MAKSLGIKQGSLSDIERGKTAGLSKRISTLLRMIYRVDIDYLYNSSDEMFIRRNEMENVEDSPLSEFSKEEITQYISNHEAEFRKDSTFKDYMSETVWYEVTKALRQAFLDEEESYKNDDPVVEP